MECKALNVLRDIFRHIQGFVLEVAGESHPDASALDQRVPSAALTNIWMCPSVTGGL